MLENLFSDNICSECRGKLGTGIGAKWVPNFGILCDGCVVRLESHYKLVAEINRERMAEDEIQAVVVQGQAA